LESKIELLAPAGNMECLKTAVYFGADAVYVSGKAYGLRAFADNFDVEQMEQASTYMKKAGKSLYVTCNAVFHNDDFIGFSDYLKHINRAGVDAIIASDPGVVMTIKETIPEMDVHLSTQANTMNAKSVKFWKDFGVSRVILAREATLDDIKRIKDEVPDVELEVFVHGAMCISYSGRCLLSNVTTGRSSNQGACAQPCRWKYTVSEIDKDEEFPVYSDENGTYLFNSKDLMMIEHLDKLIDAGVTSLKIEGRMKSAYYVASVIKPYRQEIDKILQNRTEYVFDKMILKEMDKSGTRPYTTGFFFGNPKNDGQDTTRTSETKPSVFVGKVLACDNGTITIEQRNKFVIGDELEILSPTMAPVTFIVTRIVNEAGDDQDEAPHPKQVLILDCPFCLNENDILRRNL